MADPRRTLTRRAIISYDQLRELTDWPNLLIKDYQGIIQDFAFLADEEDKLELRIVINEGNISDLQDSHYPNLSSQVQFIQQQLDGLPKFTCDTTGFTADSTEWTADKDTA